MNQLLTRLIVTINSEHRLAYDAAMDALEHAILCGETLIKAQAAVGEGNWHPWIRDNLDMGATAVGRYMRIAVYREQLLTAENRPQSINAAITYLKDIDAPPLSTSRNGRRPTFDVDEARRLKALGMTNRDIGRAVGVSDVAVWRQLTPGATRRAVFISNRNRSKRRIEQRAIAEREQVSAVAAIGGKPDEAYNLLRQCAEVLNEAIAEGAGEQHDLRKALTHVHRAENAVIRAINLEPRRHLK